MNIAYVKPRDTLQLHHNSDVRGVSKIKTSRHTTLQTTNCDKENRDYLSYRKVSTHNQSFTSRDWN